jgi:hypothetical protein
MLHVLDLPQTPQQLLEDSVFIPPHLTQQLSGKVRQYQALSIAVVQKFHYLFSFRRFGFLRNVPRLRRQFWYSWLIAEGKK